MESVKILDAKGMACPLPIIKTKKEMQMINSGEVLEVHTTDKGAKNDLVAWSKSSGHELIHQTDEDGILKFWIKKG